MLDAFLDWLASLPPGPTYAVLAALSALENVFPPVPADVAVAIGAFLAQRGEVSAPLLGLVCWLANTATAAGMYVLGRVRGDEFFHRGWGRRLLPPQVMAALHEVYAKHGVAGVFWSRFLPGVRAAVTPFAGVVAMPAAKALIPAAIASGIWYALLIAAGSALGLSWDGVVRFVEGLNAGLGVVAVVAAVAFGLWLFRRTRRPA